MPVDSAQNPFALLTLVAAPALLTNATSVLALSTINRILRSGDRMRALSAQLEDPKTNATKREFLLAQVGRVEKQALLQLRGLHSIYIALGCFAFVSSSISLGLALAAVVLIGMGVGLPYAAMFSRAGALFPGRAGAAMGLVNMLGIFMILGGAPLVGHLADLSGTFRASFVVLGGFSLAACAAVPFIARNEPSASHST